VLTEDKSLLDFLVTVQKYALPGATLGLGGGIGGIPDAMADLAFRSDFLTSTVLAFKVKDWAVPSGPWFSVQVTGPVSRSYEEHFQPGPVAGVAWYWPSSRSRAGFELTLGTRPNTPGVVAGISIPYATGAEEIRITANRPWQPTPGVYPLEKMYYVDVEQGVVRRVDRKMDTRQLWLEARVPLPGWGLFQTGGKLTIDDVKGNVVRGSFQVEMLAEQAGCQAYSWERAKKCFRTATATGTFRVEPGPGATVVK
jgi:hypothetical protein